VPETPWTIESLKEHLETLMQERDERHVVPDAGLQHTLASRCPCEPVQLVGLRFEDSTLRRIVWVHRVRRMIPDA